MARSTEVHRLLSAACLLPGMGGPLGMRAAGAEGPAPAAAFGFDLLVALARLLGFAVLPCWAATCEGDLAIAPE